MQIPVGATMSTMAIPIKLSQEGYINTWIFFAALHITAKKKKGREVGGR